MNKGIVRYMVEIINPSGLAMSEMIYESLVHRCPGQDAISKLQSAMSDVSHATVDIELKACV